MSSKLGGPNYALTRSLYGEHKVEFYQHLKERCIGPQRVSTTEYEDLLPLATDMFFVNRSMQ
jgi:hypothetical protein